MDDMKRDKKLLAANLLTNCIHCETKRPITQTILGSLSRQQIGNDLVLPWPRSSAVKTPFYTQRCGYFLFGTILVRRRTKDPPCDQTASSSSSDTVRHDSSTKDVHCKR